MTVTPRHDLSRARQLDRYLQVIAAGAHRSHLLEIRYGNGNGRMGRLFVGARRLDTAARAIRSVAPRTALLAGSVNGSHCGTTPQARRAE